MFDLRQLNCRSENVDLWLISGSCTASENDYENEDEDENDCENENENENE